MQKYLKYLLVPAVGVTVFVDVFSDDIAYKALALAGPTFICILVLLVGDTTHRK